MATVPTPVDPADHSLNEGAGVERITAFTDGVVAIAITILVLELEVPGVAATPDGAQLADELRSILHRIELYFVSFVVVGFYWYLHHQAFRFLRRHDHVLLGLNLAMLLPITILPFLTEVVGDYPGQTLAVVIYFGALSLIGAILLALWLYASHGRRLVDPALPAHVIRLVTIKLAAPPALFLLGIGAAFLHLEIAKRIYLLLFLEWIGMAALGESLRHRYAPPAAPGAARTPAPARPSP